MGVDECTYFVFIIDSIIFLSMIPKHEVSSDKLQDRGSEKNQNEGLPQRFIDLPLRAKKQRIKFYLYIKIQLTIFLINSISAGAINWSIYPNKSLCMRYHVFDNLSHTNFFLMGAIFETFFTVLWVFVLLKYVKKENKEIVNVCKLVTAFNLLYVIYKLFWYVSTSAFYLFYHDIFQEKCSTYVYAMLTLMNYSLIVGVISTAIWIIYYVCVGNYSKLLERLEQFNIHAQKEEEEQRLKQMYEKYE